MPTTQTFQSEIYIFLCFRYVRSNYLLPTEFIFPKEIKNLSRNTNISVEISSSDFASFSNVTNSRFMITLQTKLQNDFFITAYKTVVIFELQFLACVLLQTVISVQK